MPPDPDPPPQRAPAPFRGRELALQNPCGYADVRLRELRRWLTPLLDELAPGGEGFTARWVSDREMRRLNRSFRQIDRATDVLSFPGDAGEGHLGDVVIAVPTARRQAVERAHSVERELRLLLLHGVLHCLGHDHETDDGTMERLEEELRSRHLDRSPPGDPASSGGRAPLASGGGADA